MEIERVKREREAEERKSEEEKRRKTESEAPKESERKRSSSVPKCSFCGKSVYQQEMLKTDKDIFHKNCFKCAECGGKIGLGNYAALQGKYYW